MKPLVSILIPVYKVPEKFLRRCIESAMNQTMKNIEIILVDDGSPDNGGEICDEYAKNDFRIRVIHKTNGGLAAARNAAFDLAEGKYITFLDGDDYIDKDTCELSYITAEENHVQMVFWNIYIEYNNQTICIPTLDNNSHKFDKDGCRELQVRVLDYNGHISQVYSKLIRRDFLIENNIRHIDRLRQGAEGLVFNIQLFNYLEKAYYIPNYLLHYVYNNRSITHTPDEKNYYIIIECFEYMNNYIVSSDNYQNLKDMLLNRLLYVIVTTGISGYFNPRNKESYKVKKEKYMAYLSEPLIQESLKKAKRYRIGYQRRLVLLFIKFGFFRGLVLLGYIREKQLESK